MLARQKFYAAALVAAGLVPSPVFAGKYCADQVESGKAAGVTQEEALLAAQRWWSSRAGSMGRGYENWNNASEQSLECNQGSDGKFYCKAAGRPCLPEGTLPNHLPKLDM